MPRSDLEDIRAINEIIAAEAVRSGRGELKLSIDRIVDYLNVGTVALTAYERFRQSVNLRRGLLGDDIFAVSREEALRLLADSDFFVLSDPTRGRESPYPMNAEIPKYWNDLRNWALRNMVMLDKREIAGIPYQVFEKPAVKLTGASAGWITSAGIILAANPAHLVRWPLIVLEGDAPYEVLGGEPHPHAVVLDENGQSGVELPATLQRHQNHYAIQVDSRPAKLAGTEPVLIHLSFDRSFVPAQLGVNADTRSLVMQVPTRNEMRPAP
jgi:hypothetical protein